LDKNKKKINLAILGASGIGKFHARIFHKLNVNVHSILGSSVNSVNQTAQDLNASLGLNVNCFSNLNTLLQKFPPDAISICTPNVLHYEQIIKVLNKNIPIFCEKPLFWDEADDYKSFKKKLKVISDHPNRAIFVNTSSACYLRAIVKYLPPNKEINSFSFTFRTNGKHTFQGIAEDLLPHGLSMLIELLGCHEITSLNQNFCETTYECNFIYSGCKVNFIFQEGRYIKKEFKFSINSDKYVRIQNKSLSDYRVHLDCINQHKRLLLNDPFEDYASRFIDLFFSKSEIKNDEFNEASHNLTLMAKMLKT
jgi:hypothetical protein